jgi:hypothetical protein
MGNPAFIHSFIPPDRLMMLVIPILRKMLVAIPLLLPGRQYSKIGLSLEISV